MKTLIRLAAALAFAIPSIAADFPPLEFPQGVGVNIHFNRGHERDFDMIAAAGFKFVRMDLGWGGIERKKGEYDWSAYDELTSNLEKRGMRAILILDYSNGLYEDTITSVNPLTGRDQRDTASPRKPESVAAFSKWSAAAAARYKGRGIIWEVWNEPNISFWKPKPNVKDYSVLVLAACKAVREADPAATIIGPASSEFPWAFFEELFKAGALNYLDAVSVHPYRSYSKGPETAAEEYLQLRALIERYAPAAKKSMPIISGEWGYASHAKGVSLETQAAFIARQQIANVWQGVPVSIWYDWKNDGEDPAYNEHHFGTVSNDFALKPSYVAVQTFTRELSGYKVARRLDIGEADDFVLLLSNSKGAQKIAAWTAAKPHPIQVDAGFSSGTDVAIVDGQGKSVEAQLTGGRLKLNLEPAPQYITLRRLSRTLQAAAAWSIERYVPTSIEVKDGAELRIPIVMTNPFPLAVRARVSIYSPAGQSSRMIEVPPARTVSHAFTLRPTLRASAAVPYTVSVEFAGTDPEARAIGNSAEHRHFIVSNPLLVTAAPVASGLRLLVANPSGTLFKGSVVFDGSRLPIEFAAGQLETSLNIRNAPRSVALVDERGRPVTAPIDPRFTPISLAGARAVLEGDSKVPATATVTESVPPAGADQPFDRAFKLDYSFEAGWRFAQVVTPKSAPVQGSPRALGIWVYGDKSGNSLRMRVMDAQGQTFQPNGPALTWTGWRWVEFDLKDLKRAGHWGGANDGVARGALRLDTVLLVDGTRNQTSGTIYFAGAAWIY